jgi:hypothetical protein
MNLLKLFNKKKYWTLKMNELVSEQRKAKERLDRAVKLHEKRKHLRFAYDLASLRVEKAYPKYLKAMGKV